MNQTKLESPEQEERQHRPAHRDCIQSLKTHSSGGEERWISYNAKRCRSAGCLLCTLVISHLLAGDRRRAQSNLARSTKALVPGTTHSKSISGGSSLVPERQLAAKLGAFNWMKVDRPRRATSTSDRSITPEKGGNSKELKD